MVRALWLFWCLQFSVFVPSAVPVARWSLFPSLLLLTAAASYSFVASAHHLHIHCLTYPALVVLSSNSSAALLLLFTVSDDTIQRPPLVDVSSLSRLGTLNALTSWTTHCHLLPSSLLLRTTSLSSGGASAKRVLFILEIDQNF